VNCGERVKSKAARQPTENLSADGRLLVIDDDPNIVAMLTRILWEEGYQVSEACTGAEGLRIFESGHYDVVLTDLKIGDMTGIDILKRVKEVDPQTAVVILTGYASTESAIEGIRLGANDYLTKPVKMVDLVKTVRNQVSAVRMSERVTELNRTVAEERDKLSRSVAELTLLKRLAERMMSVLSYVEGFEVILTLLIEEIAADIAVIYDLERRSARVSAVSRPNPRELEQLAEVVSERGKELLGVEVDCSVDQFEGLVDEELHEVGSTLRSTIVLPLIQGERPFGLLVAASRSDEKFEEVWSEFINRLALDASEFLTRIKRSVERQRHFTAAIVEHTLDGIVLIPPGAVEVMLNPVARSILNLPSIPAPSSEEVCKQLNCNLDEIRGELRGQEADVGGQRTIVHLTELTRGEQKIYLRVNISLLPGDNPPDSGMLLFVLHDVTKERGMEEMKARLIANLTHEVRTPTAVLKEFVSLILDGVSGELNDSQRQYLSLMKSNIERLSRLTDNLLTLARADTGGFSILLQPIELVPIISEVAASMEVKFMRKHMKLSVDISDEMPLIYADREAVTQILTNLVENAQKYSPEDTEVTISAVAKGNRVEVMVADQGYGIAPEDKEEIFKRFHRLVDQDDPRFQEGVGLGLSLVKDMVVRHGGDIWVESEVGVGSTFCFTLQIAREDEEHRPA